MNSELLNQLEIGFVIMSVLIVLGILGGIYIHATGVTLSLFGHRRKEADFVRRAARISCNLPFELKDSVRQHRGSGRMINISATGARFATWLKLKKGEQIRGYLPTLVDGEKNVFGRIVWIKKEADQTQYGIQFTA